MSEWEIYEQDLKQRIIDHCKRISKFDRDYAISTFREYAQEPDYLGLRDKRTETDSGIAQSSRKATKGGRA
jgi:hypothetical protein